jgi:hypothetical protein
MIHCGLSIIIDHGHSDSYEDNDNIEHANVY